MALKRKKARQSHAASSAPEVPAGYAQLLASGALPAGVTVMRPITMPTLNLRPGEPRILKVTGAMRQSTFVDPDPSKQKEKPATVMPVVDVVTGEAMTLLLPVVLEKNLVETFPEGEYVGKTFLMEKLGKRPGKRYFDFRLLEVEYTKPEPAGV